MMLKEVEKLKKYFIGVRERGSLLYFYPVATAQTRRKIVDEAIRAVREDCAEVAESEELSGMDSTSANHASAIAAAIRGRK